MQYPSLNRSAAQSIKIPYLNGGVNLSDAVNAVSDNQLTDCKNMWWNNGALRTRPGTMTEFFKYDEDGSPTQFNAGIELGRDVKFDCDPVEYIYDGHKYVLQPYDCAVVENGTVNTAKRAFNIIVREHRNNGTFYACKALLNDIILSAQYSDYEDVTSIDARYIIFKGAPKHRGGIYCFVSAYTGYTAVRDRIYMELPKSSFPYGSGELLLEADDFYCPIVYLNGKGDQYSYLPMTQGAQYAGAVSFEGFNLLRGGFRAGYMTDSYSEEFRLPVDHLTQGNNEDVVIELTLSNLQNANRDTITTATFTFPARQADGTIIAPDEDGFYTSTEEADAKTISDTAPYWFDHSQYVTYDESGGEYMIVDRLAYGGFTCRLNRAGGYFVFLGCEDSWLHDKAISGTSSMGSNEIDITNKRFSPASSGGTANNIMVTAYKTIGTDMDRLLFMQHAINFGGADGINGGSRVFLSGSIMEPGLMLWSDVNNPLYFSENNYAYIGDDGDKITAFAKQGEMLVVFKEHEIYYTVLVEGTGITVEDVENGMDVSTAFAKFPIYQLHGEIGCDLPKTIQLCNNRLVWTTKTGDVYTLVSTYNTSEKNVYQISKNIERRLKKATIENAFAVDWSGHYVLFCNRDVFAMDYNKSSYKYAAGNDQVGNNKNFVWWIWEAAKEVELSGGGIGRYAYSGGVEYMDRLHLMCDIKTNSVSTYYFDFIYEDNIPNCDSNFTTKIFDFGVPERLKNIEQIYLSIGNDTENTIILTIYTERGEMDCLPVEVLQAQSPYTSEYGEVIKRIPNIKRIRQLGFKIESENGFSVSGLRMNFKITGSVK